MPKPASRVLLVGSFPPVGGRASGASLAALRRAWAEEDDVVTASLRAGAADLVARVGGPLAGLHLERARVAAGRPPKLVLGLEGGQLGLGEAVHPGCSSRAGGRGLIRRAIGIGVAAVTVAGLIVSLDRFEQVDILVTGPLGLPRRLGSLLWRHVDAVVVEEGEESAAIAAGVPAGRLRSVEPHRGPPSQPGVSLLGPPEVLPRDYPLFAAGALGRRLLGRHFLPVRSRLIGAARRAIRVARRAKQALLAPNAGRRQADPQA